MTDEGGMPPIIRLAKERLVRASMEIEIQLRKDVEGSAPVLILLAKGRERAAAAIWDLVHADPSNTELVRGMQNEVRLYQMLVDWVTEIITAGREAEQELSEEDRDLTLEAVVSQLEPDTAEDFLRDIAQPLN